MMKLRRFLLASIASALLSFTASMGAHANSLTFQGVTFETYASGNTLTLIISNALSGGTGNWSDINYLNAFEIKGVGDVTAAALDGWSSTTDEGLNAISDGDGCSSGGTPGACFFQAGDAVALSDNMRFDIDFKGTDLNFDAVHLKVQFFEKLGQDKATGDLLSQTVVPEPEIYAMMAVGMGVMGWVARRKKRKQAALA